MKPAVDRFWAKVRKLGESACWIWTARKDRKGYGQFRVGSKRDGTRRLIFAHQFSFELAGGLIGEGQVVDHVCRNPSCVNPGHLQTITRRKNWENGISPAAINARKTHCINGHPLFGDNLYVEPGGARHCRTCRAEITARQKIRIHAVSKTQPTREGLAADLASGLSWLRLGEKYGMSDNALRKWARKFDLIQCRVG